MIQLKEYKDAWYNPSTNTVHYGNGDVRATVYHRNKPAVNLRTLEGESKRISLMSIREEYGLVVIPESRKLPNLTSYSIMPDGKIYSHIVSRWLTPTINKVGYRAAVLKTDEGEVLQEYVHRLVAKAFVEGDQTLTVNHIDGNKLNNNYTNLEWISNEDNLKHAWETGLQDSRNKGCAISTDGKEWQHFPRLVDAKKVIEEELGVTIVNACKLGKAAKQNDTKDMNKGYPVTKNPYRYRGYIVMNTLGKQLPEKFQELAEQIDNTLYSEGLEKPVEVSKDNVGWTRYNSGKEAAEAINANRSKIVRVARQNEMLSVPKYKTVQHYIRYAA